jgi:hypothetical protein
MVLMQLLLKQRLLQADAAGQFQKMGIVSVSEQAAQNPNGTPHLNILMSWN